LGDADRGYGASQPGGWIYQLLPFMGLDMIHDLGKGQGSGINSSSQKYTTDGPSMKSSPVPIFICPTRRQNKPYPDGIKQGAYNSAFSPTLNKTDYAANAGSLGPTEPFAGPPTTCYSTFPKCAWDQSASATNGVVGQASQVTPGSITDGSSHTFFAGEKSLAPDNYYNSMDPGDDNSMLQGFDHDTIRWCTQTLLPVRDTRGVFSTNNQFGSAHPAGVHFVYCDGSVRIIPYQINPTIYQNLGCRNDGNVSENY